MKLVQRDDTTWEISRTGAMRVPARVIADERLLPDIRKGRALEQVCNVACLPGIVRYALAMPDAHWGYGFPIGGVAATDPEQDGVISPGGVGYDINCGVRVVTTALRESDFSGRIKDIIEAWYRDIPAGVGAAGAIGELSKSDMKAVLREGARWAVNRGYGSRQDLEVTESEGCMVGADDSEVSDRAKSRGRNQLGSLGSGNHFIELARVEKIYDARIAGVYGLREGYLAFTIHSGSRGLGYQVCDDFLQLMVRAAARYRIDLPDRQLCCAPVHSPEGRAYLAAMAAAANYAWANRQILMALACRSLTRVLGLTPGELGARLLYDGCHNIARFEMHQVDGNRRRLCVHRKGATRSFPPGHREVPAIYEKVGQPVLIPGDMGTASYICAGTQTALEQTFGSCCHGAGRILSRAGARKQENAAALIQQLSSRHIIVKARSKRTLAEEAPDAYKDIDVVAEVTEQAGIGHRVARLRPLGVVKG